MYQHRAGESLGTRLIPVVESASSSPSSASPSVSSPHMNSVGVDTGDLSGFESFDCQVTSLLNVLRVPLA